MKTFEKCYIGKGRKVEDLEIVTVTLKMEEAEKHILEMEGKRFLRFEVAALRETDKYGGTHTCYVSKLVDAVNEGEMTTLPENKPKATVRKNSRKK